MNKLERYLIGALLALTLCLLAYAALSSRKATFIFSDGTHKIENARIRWYIEPLFRDGKKFTQQGFDNYGNPAYLEEEK